MLYILRRRRNDGRRHALGVYPLSDVHPRVNCNTFPRGERDVIFILEYVCGRWAEYRAARKYVVAISQAASPE